MYNLTVKWLQSHLLPCIFKLLFGIDCPGCGFQRSCIALLRGDFLQSLRLYPATIPLLVTCVFLLIDSRYHIDKNSKIRKGLYWFTGLIIAVAYINKMTLLYYRH